MRVGRSEALGFRRHGEGIGGPAKYLAAAEQGLQFDDFLCALNFQRNHGAETFGLRTVRVVSNERTANVERYR